MNRAQRRAFRENLSDRKFREKIARYCVSSDEHRLSTGDRVKLNTAQIMGRGEYKTLQKEYQDFIKTNGEHIFTVRLHRDHTKFPAVVELAEEPKWLFWEGDLILVKDGGDPNQ